MNAVKSFVKLRHTVEVYRPGEPVRDRFNNLVPGSGSWAPVRVAQWWVHRTEEDGEDSVLRTIDLLTIHIPVGDEPPPGGKVRLLDGTEWEVQGNPEDYNHGFHGWSPGLMIVNCTRTEG